MGHLIWSCILSGVILAMLSSCERTPTYRVPGGGVQPNIATGQNIELNENAYRTPGDVRRGDVVVLHSPQDASRLFVKRVLGLPGETVSVVDGKVSINGTTLELVPLEGDVFVEDVGDKRYRVKLTSPCLPEPTETILGPDAFFLLGDNRCASLDSRSFGPVTFESIRGAVALGQ